MNFKIPKFLVGKFSRQRNRVKWDFLFFFQVVKAKKNCLQAEYLEVVHGLIKGLNAPTRVTEEKQRPIGHVTTTPASDIDMGFLCRFRAEGFSGKAGIPEKIKIRSSRNR